MPSSPLKWSSDHPRSIFQAYACKRKVDCGSQSIDCEGSANEKRHCQWSTDSLNRFQNGSASYASSNQNNCVQGDLNNESRQMSSETAHATDSTSMDVDITTTESTVGRDLSADQTSTTHLPAEDRLRESAGKISPASGILRCYCRPSWDAMMYPQPFNSDYY